MISVIIPAKNEEKHITSTVDDFEKLDVDEIVIVEDGSTDNTYNVLKQLAKKYKNVKVIQNKTNMGKGYAMRAGAKEAKGDVLVFFDASQFYPKEAVPLLLKTVKKGIMAVGMRNFSAIPWYRKTTISLTKLAFLMRFSANVRDPLSGVRAVYRDDYMKIRTRENRYAVESEINCKFLKNKGKIEYIPVRATYDGTPTSILNFKECFLITVFLIKMVLRIV